MRKAAPSQPVANLAGWVRLSFAKLAGQVNGGFGRGAHKMSSDLPRLYLARHGDTAWTDSRQHTGRTDIPLNARGEEHARHLGERLRGFSFARVFTSPLQRASKTCELAGFGAVAEVDADLLEWDYGRWEGMLTSDILKDRPGWQLFRDGCPDGESPEDVAARADRFIARIHGMTGDLLAFSSGHIIRMIAARWHGMPPAAGRVFYCRPASVGVLDFEHDRRDEPIIRLWNYVSEPRE
jgi:probable phosphoglycerate mutase